MSTSALVVFSHRGERVAVIRRYSDGYPQGEHGMLRKFDEFLADIAEQATVPTANAIGDRMEWLAAEYVAWCHRDQHPHSLQRCGVVANCEDGADFHYSVSGGGRPIIRHVPRFAL